MQQINLISLEGTLKNNNSTSQWTYNYKKCQTLQEQYLALTSHQPNFEIIIDENQL
jgi:hypothetical protein